MPEIDYIDVEIHLMESGRLRLRCPDQQEFAGDFHLDEDVYQTLLELEHRKDFGGYGKVLFEAIFPVAGEPQRGLYSMLDRARREETRLRLRLNVDTGVPSHLHGLHWELLKDGKDFEAGRSPETAFSRYISRPDTIGPPPGTPRMLCVIAAPIDAHRHKLAPIDFEYTRRQLETSLAALRDSLRIEFLERPVTPERLRQQLRAKRYDLLHVHGHGTLPSRGESALVLEDADHRVNLTPESALRGILLGLRQLKLVTLVACHGGAQPVHDDLLSGLAGSLVKENVPAVVAMRRAISVKTGLRFTDLFYRELAEHPCVDAAINEARHQLYMENPDGVDWSSPVLYMRLEDGRLWSGRDLTSWPRRPKRVYVLGLCTLLLGLIGIWWQFAPPSDSQSPKHSPVEATEQRGFLDGSTTDAHEAEKPAPEPLPPPPTIALERIVEGRVGVATVDRETSQWRGDTARIVARQLRDQRPDLSPVVVSAALRSQLGRIFDGDLSFLRTGDKAADGLEYLVLIAQDHKDLPSMGPFLPVSVTCEVTLISTRESVIKFQEVFGHTGNSNTRAGALEQAFGRCVSEAETQFP